MSHARYRLTPDISANIAFIDEDIMSRHLLPVRDFSVYDLDKLYQGMREYSVKGADQVKAIFDELRDATRDTVHQVQKASLFHSEDMIELITSKRVCFPEESAILEFLSGNTVAYARSSYKAHSDKVYFVQNNRDKLPDIPTIIASATVNKRIYESFFGEQLHWQEIPMIEYRGKLVQHAKKGYSNSYLRQALARGSSRPLEEFQEKVGLQACITTKEWKETLDKHGIEHNIVGTYGALEGLNDLEGEDLVLWGTLHCPPLVYALVAYALGRRVGIGDCHRKRVEVERNGHRFPFVAYSDDELLREIQFYLIEEPMVQAVGRARLAEHPATVTVYSNYILPQATIN